MLTLDNVTRTFTTGRRRRTVVKGVSHTFEPGTLYSIVGPSGSGKTTLLSMVAGLDSPTSGTISLNGRDIRQLGLNRYRNRHAATVFQSYNLLTYLNAIRNVTAAMEITGVRGHRRRRAAELLTELGIDDDHQRRNVLQLSGGQQQRVAIARALACDVDVLLADEPTGNLDAETADGIVDTFRDLAHRHGTCVIVVTHSAAVAEASDHTLNLRKGKLSR